MRPMSANGQPAPSVLARRATVQQLFLHGDAHSRDLPAMRSQRRTSRPGRRWRPRTNLFGVCKQAPQMVDRFVRTGFVKALMSQRDVAGGQSGQQFLDPGRALPGQNTGGPVDIAQRLDDWRHGLRAAGAVDHQSGQIPAKRATGTGSATVEIAFGSALSTGEVSGNPCTRHTDWLAVAIGGQAGKYAIVTASRADSAGTHRCVETAVAQVFIGPGRPALVGHSLTPAAAELLAGNARAAPFGGAPVGANRHR